MKKLLLTLPLIAGASWAGTSYYAGTQTQDAYQQLLAQLGEIKPLTVENESYTQGMLQSSAITLVKDSASDNAQVLFRLKHDIDHSAVGYDDQGVRIGTAVIRTTLLIDPDSEILDADTLSRFEDGQPFELVTRIGTGGSSNSLLSISGYAHDYDDTRVSFAGGEYTLDTIGDVLTGKGEIGEILVEDDEGRMRISPMQIAQNMKRVASGVYTGDYNMDIAEIRLEGEAFPDTIVLSDLGMASDASKNNDRFDTTMVMRVGDIAAPIPVNSGKIDVAVKGLSLEGLKRYTDEVGRISLLGDDLDDPATAQAFLEAYKHLIVPGVSVDYGIEVSNDGGDMALNYGLGILDKGTGDVLAVSTVRDVLDILRLELHLDADAAAVDQTPLAMVMMQPQAQQYILSDGVSYTSDIVVQDMLVDINGNPLSLEMMLGEMLDMPLDVAASM